MIYGQDEPMLFPVADLYDSSMMQMYINAAREQYNQNREDMKEFQKTYGDFFSPFSKDMEWVDAQTRGRVNDALNYMQANGIDPLRSAEGRALVQKIIRETNVAGINQRRANAKMAEEYIKNRGTMIANGTYNPDYENYLLAQMGLGRFEDFDSSMGPWTRTSPSKYQDLNAATSSWFDDLKGEDLGLDPTGRYRMFGVNEDQLQRSMSSMLPGFVHTDLGGYYYNLAKKQLQAEGNAAPSEDEILGRLRSGIVGANKEKMYTKYDTDDYAKLAVEDAYERAKENREFARQKELENLKTDNEIRKIVARYGDANDPDGTGSSGSSGSGGRGNNKKTLSDAQYQLMRGTTGIIAKTQWGRNAGITNYTDFDPDWMDNILPAAQEEISWKFYDNNISGGTDQIVRTAPAPTIGYNPTTGKVELNTPRNYFDISNYSTVNTSTVPPATTKQQINKLKDANRGFIDELSMDYTPAKFAKWTNKSTLSTDNSMVNIQNDVDAVNRMVSVDEIALSSAGVNRPIEDYNWAKKQTDSIRKKVSKGDKLYMKSTGKVVTSVAADGSVHMYQLVKIYKDKSNTTTKHDIQEEIGVVGYDMGIDTYSNPNFGVNNNTHTNLFFDENKDADVRWSGDQSVLHWENINPSGISSNAAYPTLP